VFFPLHPHFRTPKTKSIVTRFPVKRFSPISPNPITANRIN